MVYYIVWTYYQSIYEKGLIAAMKTNYDINYFDDLNSENSWVRFKTKLKMFFYGYDFNELASQPNLKSSDSVTKSETISEQPSRIQTNLSFEKKESNSAPAQDNEPHKYAYIPKDTIIEGSVVTKSNIVICGLIKGDVVCENHIEVSGKIEGNIITGSINISKGVITGNIACKGVVEISDKSIVLGDVEGESIDCNGEIKGNIKTTKSVVLKSGAIIFGNIITRIINMQNGAILKGQVEMPNDNINTQVLDGED